MKNTTKKFLKAGVVLFIAVLFTATSVSAMGNTQGKAIINATPKTATCTAPSRDTAELKYYNEENLSQVIGISGGTGPYIWKTAIRLTQDELAAYAAWTINSVNVAFSADNGVPVIDIRIFIYDKGSSDTRPGAIIVNDTTYTLDTTGVINIPLVTPVPLSGHEELWVAVQWTQIEAGPGVYYAWLDDITGPAIAKKSDWVYLNNAWSQIHLLNPDINGRWGIGAIAEGSGLAELAILNVKGPIGVKADVQNSGDADALNVQCSMTVTGGLLGLIDKSATGSAATLAPSGTVPLSSGIIIGFGKITIVITASADNAVAVSATKSAFVLGPLVTRIQ
jgi:hypothetical protein